MRLSANSMIGCRSGGATMIEPMFNKLVSISLRGLYLSRHVQQIHCWGESVASGGTASISRLDERSGLANRCTERFRLRLRRSGHEE